MKMITVVPLELGRPTLGRLLEGTERRLRGGSTTFIRRKKRRWVHAKYPGWITWDVSRGGTLNAQVQSKIPESEWQLLQAFVGYLNRHLSENIDSITIRYYE